MSDQIDKKAQARMVGAIIGAILGVVVAFAFGFAKLDTATVSTPSTGDIWKDMLRPQSQTVTTGYGLEALGQVAAVAFVFGWIGWSLGDQAGKQLYR